VKKENLFKRFAQLCLSRQIFKRKKGFANISLGLNYCSMGSSWPLSRDTVPLRNAFYGQAMFCTCNLKIRNCLFLSKYSLERTKLIFSQVRSQNPRISQLHAASEKHRFSKDTVSVQLSACLQWEVCFI
jgi:hypothetical protein